MTEIRSLGYLGLSADPDAWAAFGSDVLGAEVRHAGGATYLRFDDHGWRIAIEDYGTERRLAFVGWQVADEESLRSVAERLDAAGYPTKSDPAAAERRGVRSLVYCTDPSGIRTEFFYGPTVPQDPFASPLGASFVMDTLGLGHVVLATPEPQATLDFYLGLLGFRLSDTIIRDGRPPTHFLHVNPRHHSVAVASAPQADLHHFMLEVTDLTTVGRCLDRARDAGAPIVRDLGEHINDWMTSFYLQAPGGVEIEFGAGARLVDDAVWSASTYNVISRWGHRLST